MKLAPVLTGKTLAAARHSHLDSAQGRQHTHHTWKLTLRHHTLHRHKGAGLAGPSLIGGREDLPRDDLGGGLEELVLAFALEEGVGAVDLRVGGVEHLCCPVAHL